MRVAAKKRESSEFQVCQAGRGLDGRCKSDLRKTLMISHRVGD